jgi:hypothetical protein
MTSTSRGTSIGHWMRNHGNDGLDETLVAIIATKRNGYTHPRRRLPRKNRAIAAVDEKAGMTSCFKIRLENYEQKLGLIML